MKNSDFSSCATTGSMLVDIRSQDITDPCFHRSVYMVLVGIFPFRHPEKQGNAFD